VTRTTREKTELSIQELSNGKVFMIKSASLTDVEKYFDYLSLNRF